MYGKRRSVYVILITYNKNSCYSKKNGDKKYLHDIFLLLCCIEFVEVTEDKADQRGRERVQMFM